MTIVDINTIHGLMSLGPIMAIRTDNVLTNIGHEIAHIIQQTIPIEQYGRIHEEIKKELIELSKGIDN
jgi:hypothetical protein